MRLLTSALTITSRNKWHDANTMDSMGNLPGALGQLEDVHVLDQFLGFIAQVGSGPRRLLDEHGVLLRPLVDIADRLRNLADVFTLAGAGVGNFAHDHDDIADGLFNI